MNCHHVRKLLEKRADGEIEAARVLEMKAHLTSCADCQSEYAGTGSTLASIHQRFDVLPNIKASPDFDMRVLDAVLPQLAQSDSFFDRLDTIFARPIYKLLGSTALGLFLAALTIAAVVVPQSREGSTPSLPGMVVSTAAVRETRSQGEYYAVQGLVPKASYADLMRELYPVEATPPRRRKSGRRDSSWDAATSESSYSLLSGSLC